jgi:hypothetical protein
MMAERVLDPAQPPALLVRRRVDQPRSGLDGVGDDRIRIGHDQQHAHAAAADAILTLEEIQNGRPRTGHRRVQRHIVGGGPAVDQARMP